MWQLMAGKSLASRGWDDEYVVYNPLSGDTHLLGADAMQLLSQLSAGPADEDALAQALHVEPDEREGMAVMLGELAALFLIEPV
jgi:PqqD family protein of HPr-rel-A system